MKRISIPPNIKCVVGILVFADILLASVLIPIVWLSMLGFFVGAIGMVAAPLFILWHYESHLSPSAKEELYWNGYQETFQAAIRRLGAKTVLRRLYALIPEEVRTVTKVVVVRGPSGAGKDCACKTLQEQGFWHKIVTITTRPEIREGEAEGVDYYFRSIEQFAADKAANLLGEETNYVGSGHRYGIYKTDMENAKLYDLNYIILDSVGYAEMKAYYGSENVIGIFLHADKTELERRILGRGDSADQVAKRLSSYDQEMDERKLYPISIDVTALNPEEQANALRQAVLSLL